MLYKRAPPFNEERPMRRRFTTLDVFTAKRFAGNPLAVVLEAEGLSGEAMQTIAREFNLSETVFVLPPENAGHRAKLRIFTPAAELPFAGHPTVGTAVLLGRVDGKAGRQDMVLEEGVGLVRCRVEPLDDDGGRASFELPKLPEHRGEAGDAVDIAAALTLELDDLGCDDFEPGKWSAGVPFAMIPVRGLDAIGRSRPNRAIWDTAFGTPRPTGPFLFCRETVEAGHSFHARMFAPHMGIVEDPATGSAAAAFAGLLAQHENLPDGSHEFTIEQGYEMGRPSQIRLTLTIQRGALTGATIGGDVVVVSEGTIEA
jgi:trans-2,3-dihydro-3-hydroxyanthranilate isomerase